MGGGSKPLPVWEQAPPVCQREQGMCTGSLGAQGERLELRLGPTWVGTWGAGGPGCCLPACLERLCCGGCRPLQPLQ